MRRVFVSLAVSVVLLSVALVPANAGTAGEQWPDLRTLPPGLRPDGSWDLSVQQGTQKELRFASFTWNAADGGGGLELYPRHSRKARVTDVYQRIYSHDASDNWYVVREILVGKAEYHRGHGHWHIRDFYLHQLHADGINGAIGSPLANYSGRKTTFCVAETHRYGGTPEHARSTTTYPSSNCSQNTGQGLWVGWGDLYPSNVSGQSIGITNLADGIYWLRSTVDPADGSADRLNLTEVSKDNNWAATRFAVSGTTVTVLGTATPP